MESSIITSVGRNFEQMLTELIQMSIVELQQFPGQLGVRRFLNPQSKTSSAIICRGGVRFCKVFRGRVGRSVAMSLLRIPASFRV